jgi:hypothetical protein
MGTPLDDIVGEVVGQTVTRVFIDQWSVGLLFDSGSLNVEGQWTLYGRDDEVIDKGEEVGERRYFHLWKLVGAQPVRAEIRDSRDLILMFNTGYRFVCHSDQDGYEDWDVSLDDGRIVIANDGV